jgi:HSP20 family molecular chaperone IbpA
MTKQRSTELPVIHKSDGLFKTFDHIQNMIQERANQIFHNRTPDQGDELSDWLSAESEILTDVNLTMQDDKDQIVIEGNMKGFLPKEVEVKAKDGLFKISGTHTEESNSKKKGVTKTSSQQVYFCKSFNLPDSVETDKMEVKLKRGQFTARIPKTAH